MIHATRRSAYCVFVLVLSTCGGFGRLLFADDKLQSELPSIIITEKSPVKLTTIKEVSAWLLRHSARLTRLINHSDTFKYNVLLDHATIAFHQRLFCVPDQTPPACLPECRIAWHPAPSHSIQKEEECLEWQQKHPDLRYHVVKEEERFIAQIPTIHHGQRWEIRGNRVVAWWCDLSKNVCVENSETVSNTPLGVVRNTRSKCTTTQRFVPLGIDNSCGQEPDVAARQARFFSPARILTVAVDPAGPVSYISMDPPGAEGVPKDDTKNRYLP